MMDVVSTFNNLVSQMMSDRQICVLAVAAVILLTNQNAIDQRVAFVKLNEKGKGGIMGYANAMSISIHTLNNIMLYIPYNEYYPTSP
jgi:hypothetical protein